MSISLDEVIQAQEDPNQELVNQIQYRCRTERVRFYSTYEQNLPARLKEVFESSAYFAGGCIASQILGEEPKDWDIFLSTEKTRNEVRAFFEEQNRLSNPSILALTDNAITLKGGFQIITCEFAPPDIMTREIFDFMHTRGWFQFKNNGTLYIPKEVWESCYYKRLVPTLPREKLSMERVQRFLKRGWTMDEGELEGLMVLRNVDLGDGALEAGGVTFQDSWGS